MAEKGRVYNTRSRKKSQEARESEILNVDISEDDNIKEDPEAKIPDCAICLQPCSYPARLPCRHIFCFLCLKGAALNNRRCPMCRTPIPHDYLDNPEILETPKPSTAASETYKWYYEGRHGWWEYDARTSRDLETAFLAKERSLEVLLAGAVFVIDFARMTQIRQSGRGKIREVRRDKNVLPTKGVAGIRKHRRLPPTPQQARDQMARRRSRFGRTYNYDNFINETISMHDVFLPRNAEGLLEYGLEIPQVEREVGFFISDEDDDDDDDDPDDLIAGNQTDADSESLELDEDDDDYESPGVDVDDRETSDMDDYESPGLDVDSVIDIDDDDDIDDVQSPIINDAPDVDYGIADFFDDFDESEYVDYI